VFVSHPFRAPQAPGTYTVWAFGDEESADFRFGSPVVGDSCAAVEYWAVIRTEGREQTLGGVAVIRFAPDGRVVEQRDYWAMEDGAPRTTSGLALSTGPRRSPTSLAWERCSRIGTFAFHTRHKFRATLKSGGEGRRPRGEASRGSAGEARAVAVRDRLGVDASGQGAVGEAARGCEA